VRQRSASHDKRQQGFVRIEGVRDADMPSQAMQDVIDTLRGQQKAAAVSPRPPWNSAAPRSPPQAAFIAAGRRGGDGRDRGRGTRPLAGRPGADTGRCSCSYTMGVTSSVRCAATGSWPPGWDGPAGCGVLFPE